MVNRILTRYILKESALNILAVLLVLLLILVGGVFVKLLAKVADGTVEMNLLFPMLAWGSIKSISTLTVVSVFLGVLLTLGRLYKDSEVYAMRASGMGNWQLLVPFLTLTSLICAILFAIAAWVGPEAERQVRSLRTQAAAKVDLAGITPGKFVSLPGGGRVVFADRLNSETRELEKIYLFEELGDGVRSISAKVASQTKSEETGGKYLELSDGRIFQGNPDGRGVTSGSFGKMGIKLPDTGDVEFRERVDMLSFTQLREKQGPAEIAEFHWRLSFPISLLVLTILALPLSHTGPRQGRFANLAIAVLLYIFYANLLGFGKTLLEKESLPDVMGLWWVHLVFLVLGFALWTQQAGGIKQFFRMGKTA